MSVADLETLRVNLHTAVTPFVEVEGDEKTQGLGGWVD